MSEQLLGVFLAVDEEVHDSVVEHLVVAVAEQVGPVDVGGGLAHHVLDVVYGPGGRLVIGCAVDEIEHVLLVEGLAVAGLVFLGHGLGQVAHRELAAFMMGEICPVLLDVHLVGVELVELDPGVLVLVHEAMDERGCKVGEIVHLRGLIFKDHHHPVQFGQLLPSLAVDPQPADGEYHVVGSLLDPVATFLGSDVHDVSGLEPDVLQLDDVIGVDSDPVRSPEGLLLERIGLDSLELDPDLSLVVGPVHLLPDVEGEAAVGSIAGPYLVAEPAACLSGLVPVGGAKLQRAHQAQAKPHAVLLCEVAYSLDYLHIFILVGGKFPLRAGLGTVLAEELVESDRQGPVPPLLPGLADFPEAHFHMVVTSGHVDLRIRVEEGPELVVRSQDNAGRPDRRLERKDRCDDGHCECE